MNWKYSQLLVLVMPFTVQAKTVFLQIRDFNFNPNFIEIEQGDTVLWTNQGNMPHTVEGAGMDSGTIEAGATFEFTFSDPGNFDYICGLHPSMTGRISVIPVAAAEEPILDGNDEEALLDEPEDGGESLSEFFETNNTASEPDFSTPPTTEPSVESNNDSMAEMNHHSSPRSNATLSTSGGDWIYAGIFGLLGAVLFFGLKQS